MTKETTVKTKRPTSIRVGSRIYTVRWDQESYDRTRLGEDHLSLWGHTNHDDLVITIKPDLHPYNQKTTLLHEAMHCLYHVTGADVRNVTHTAEMEEYTISRLEEPLMDLLRNNPGMLAYLVSNE